MTFFKKFFIGVLVLILLISILPLHRAKAVDFMVQADQAYPETHNCQMSGTVTLDKAIYFPGEQIVAIVNVNYFTGSAYNNCRGLVQATSHMPNGLGGYIDASPVTVINSFYNTVSTSYTFYAPTTLGGGVISFKERMDNLWEPQTYSEESQNVFFSVVPPQTTFPPLVISPTSTNITQNSVTLGANVSSLGLPASISARGICLTTEYPATTNCFPEGGLTTGIFTTHWNMLNGLPLTPNTTYYYSGYATNAMGTSYSSTGQFTTLSNSPVISLEKDLSNTKNLIKYNDSSSAGTVYLRIKVNNINNLPEAGCTLTNTNDGTTYGTYGNDINIKYKSISGFTSPDNNFQLICRNSSGIVIGQSQTQLVKVQSGSLSSSATKAGITQCIIPAEASSCSLPITWQTVNPMAGVTTSFVGANPQTEGNGGNNVMTTILSPYTSFVPRTVALSIKNKIDGDFNYGPTDNQLASLGISISCEPDSLWDGKVCAPSAIGVDIWADPAGPLTKPGSTNLVWTTTGSPTSCDADGLDWSGTDIKNGDLVTKRSGMVESKTYTFKIKCYKGALTATDQVNVVVGTSNLSPVVNAGPYRTALASSGLQDASVTIRNGDAFSYDPDGTIVLNKWTRSTAPPGNNNVVITNDTTLTPTISGMGVGRHIFTLTATDNEGVKTYDQTSVMVSNYINGTLPTVVAESQPNPITPYGGTFHFDVTDNGDGIPDELTEKGMCYSETSPAIDICAFYLQLGNPATTLEVPIGPYYQHKSSFKPRTTYYYRGYAINRFGKGYSPEYSFTTTGSILVNPSQMSHSVPPGGNINFTYTSSIDFTPTGRSCRLLDNNLVPLTSWVTADTAISYPAPANNNFGPYSYTIQCRNDTYTHVVGISNPISVTVEEQTFPDLVATETWPTNVYTGTTTFFATILNSGTSGTEGQFRNRFQTKDKDDKSGVITNYDTGLVETLGVGVSKTVEKSINFPNAGVYYMRVCADLPPDSPGTINRESNEDNNCGPWVEVIVVMGQSDLIASVPTPNDVVIGNSIFYSDITNQGVGGTISSFTNQFQVSTLPEGDKITATYSTVQMPALEPYVTNRTSVLISFPTAGTFYVRACADLPPMNPGQVFNESNEGNNCSAWGTVIVSDSYPDLVISTTYPNEVFAGKSIFYASVTNQGETGTVKSFYNKFQVSNKPDGEDIIGTYPTALISPLASYTTAGTSVVIDLPSEGIYYMRACADLPPDSPGTIEESTSEGNNCSSNWVLVNAKKPVDGIDLTASTTYPKHVPVGETRFYSDIQNGGSVGTGLSFNNQFQVSTKPDGDDIIGTYPTKEMPALDGTMTESASQIIEFPNVGTYYMRACADLPPESPGQIKDEVDEKNNCSEWTELSVEECMNGATNYPACNEGGDDKKNGQCDLSDNNRCFSVGGLDDIDDSTNSYLWNCLGENGGTTDYCLKSKDVVGGDPMTLNFTSARTWIFKNKSAVISWSSNADAGTCVGEGFDTAGQSSGSVSVTPERTTVYTISGCQEKGVDLGVRTIKIRVINLVIVEI